MNKDYIQCYLGQSDIKLTQSSSWPTPVALVILDPSLVVREVYNSLSFQ